MDSRMAAEEPPKIPVREPENLHPLARLAWRIDHNKYKTTPKEGQVLGNCFDDAKWYFLNAPLAAGALAWSCGTRLKAFPRILLTISAAVIGNDMGSRFAGYLCVKNILSLENSPLRGELIAILRQDKSAYANLLKSELAKEEERQPLPVYATDDHMPDVTLPASSKDRAARIDDRNPSNFEPSEGQYSTLGNGHESTRLSRLWKPEPKEAMARKDSGGADLMADPFDLMMQSPFVDHFTDGAEDDVKGWPAKDRRRSRMSAKERREYDRKLYQRRQQEDQNV